MLFERDHKRPQKIQTKILYLYNYRSGSRRLDILIKYFNIPNFLIKKKSNRILETRTNQLLFNRKIKKISIFKSVYNVSFCRILRSWKNFSVKRKDSLLRKNQIIKTVQVTMFYQFKSIHGMCLPNDALSYNKDAGKHPRFHILLCLDSKRT